MSEDEKIKKENEIVVRFIEKYKTEKLIEDEHFYIYDILDKSYSTGKTIGKLAEGIELSWSSRIKSAYYPTIYEN
jgi:hypothetical protein